MARETPSTEVDGREADRTRGGENHGSRIGNKGEGEWSRGLCTCCMGKQGGKVGKGDSRHQQSVGHWLLATTPTYIEGPCEELA